MNILISIVFLLGGFRLLFESRKRHIIYLASGFILYGIQFLLTPYVLSESVQVVFSIPRILGSLLIMFSALCYLRGECK